MKLIGIVSLVTTAYGGTTDVDIGGGYVARVELSSSPSDRAQIF